MVDQPIVLKPNSTAVASIDDFPGLRKINYLNSAGIGLVPQPVQEAVADFAAAIGERGSVGYFSQYENLMTDPRLAVARLYQVPVECTAVITSISEAISQIAWWRRPRRGENVVLIDIDSNAVTYPWIRVAQETGAEIRFVRVQDDPASLTIDKIAALVNDDTAAICVSHVQWITGLRLELSALAQLAQANDALLVVDAMHSAGVLPFSKGDLAEVDFLVTGAFKWLCGYAGAGGIYVNPRHLEEFTPVLVGSRSADPEPPFHEIDVTTINLPPDARRFEYGSSITLARVAMRAAIDYLAKIGFETIETHLHDLGDHLIDGLNSLNGKILTPIERDQRAGIVTAAFPQADSLYQGLLRRDTIISLRGGALRFAPHHFNDEEDIERAMFALRDVMAQGQ